MKQDKPLVFFDLEATGTSPENDRIVDIALVKRLPDGEEISFVSLVNPGMPIPREAIEVHHITDAMVCNAPSFKELAPSLLDFLLDCDLAGFGVVRYDIPMIQNEFKRAGFEFKLDGRRVVDALTIYHRMERRNLSAAYKFYCGKDLDGAHRAEADARASAEVFWAQLDRYPELPKDLSALAAFCSLRDPKAVDAEGKFVWRNGEAAFNFGKHRTMTLREIAVREPGYITWLMNAERTTPELAKICRDALDGKFPKQAQEAPAA